MSPSVEEMALVPAGEHTGSYNMVWSLADERFKVWESLGYLELIRPEWSFHAVESLGYSPTMRDIFMYCRTWENSVNVDVWRRKALSERVAVGAREMHYALVDTGSFSPESSQLLVLLALFQRDPSNVALSTRLGDPAHVEFGFYGSSSARTELDVADVAKSLRFGGGSSSWDRLGFSAEVEATISRTIPVRDTGLLAESGRVEDAAARLWAYDAKKLPGGYCYLACFRPSVRKAVSGWLKAWPDIWSFYATYVAAGMRGWLVDFQWNVQFNVVTGTSHLLRAKARGRVAGNMRELEVLGLLGYGDRVCGSVGFMRDISQSCKDCELRPRFKQGGVRACSCDGDVCKAANSSAVDKTAVNWAAKMENLYPQHAMAVRVGEHEPRGSMFTETCTHEVKNGESFLVRICHQFGRVVINGTFVEVLVPAGTYVNISDVSFNVDRAMSIMGRGRVSLQFRSSTNKEPPRYVLVRGHRDWIWWHHYMAGADPTTTEARFYTACDVPLVIHTGLDGIGASVLSVHTRYLMNGTKQLMYDKTGLFGYQEGGTENGAWEFSTDGVVVKSFGADLLLGILGSVVRVEKEVAIGIGSAIPKFSFKCVEEQWDMSVEITLPEDDYVLDGGGPSFESESGRCLFLSAY